MNGRMFLLDLLTTTSVYVLSSLKNKLIDIILLLEY